MINKFLYIEGGSETYIFKLSDYLKKQNHDVQYFGMLDERNIIPNNPETMVKNIDFHGNNINKILYPFKIIYSIEARRKLRKIIKDFHPDVIHLNNFNFQLTPSIIYEASKFNLPIIQTIHDPNIICPSHKFYNGLKNEICEKCYSRKFYNCMFTKCIHGSFLRSILGTIEAYAYHMLNTYSKISYFISPSKFMADKFIKFGFLERKIKVLHNFIDDNKPKEYFKKNYVLYFGRISLEKGIRTLLKVIADLNHIQFIVAGSGPLENELSCYDNLEYVGFKKGDELLKLIGESLFTIIPSEIYENCPMSVLESFSLATPVIGSNIGGIPELIGNKCGLLFESGNYKDMREKIEYLYENEQLRKELSMNCRTCVDEYSIQKYYVSLMEIYKEAIREKSK